MSIASQTLSERDRTSLSWYETGETSLWRAYSIRTSTTLTNNLKIFVLGDGFLSDSRWLLWGILALIFQIACPSLGMTAGGIQRERKEPVSALESHAQTVTMPRSHFRLKNHKNGVHSNPTGREISYLFAEGNTPWYCPIVHTEETRKA